MSYYTPAYAMLILLSTLVSLVTAGTIIYKALA